jgi:hypothetical protein
MCCQCLRIIQKNNSNIPKLHLQRS